MACQFAATLGVPIRRHIRRANSPPHCLIAFMPYLPQSRHKMIQGGMPSGTKTEAWSAKLPANQLLPKVRWQSWECDRMRRTHQNDAVALRAASDAIPPSAAHSAPPAR